jgi:hypothetical protein
MQKIEGPEPRRLTLHRETLRNLVAGSVLMEEVITSCGVPCCNDIKQLGDTVQ